MKLNDERTLKVSALVLGMLTSAACTQGFQLESSSNATSAISPWDKGQVSPLETILTSQTSGCSIGITDGMNRDEELRVQIYSQGLVQVQVSVGNSDFIDLGTVRGTLTWAGNSFPAGTYFLQFRGVLADGSVTPCDPASRTVTIYENVTTPVTNPVTPTPETPTPTPEPVSPPVTQPVTPPISTGFTSLHQYSLRIARKPAEGSYDYEFYNYVGFKNQYNPDDAMTGCSIGTLTGSCAFPWAEATTVGLSFTDRMIGYNVPKAFRFFVTAGTTDVRMAGYAQQRTAFVYAIRMGQAPSRTAAVSAAEYSAIQANEHIDSSYSRLANGEEILVAHDGGGTVRFLSGKAISNGGWIYVRQLAISEGISGMQVGDTLYDIQLAIVANKADFIQHYRRLQFNAYGDPE